MRLKSASRMAKLVSRMPVGFRVGVDITFEPLDNPGTDPLAMLLDTTLPPGKRLDALLCVVDDYAPEYFDLLLALLQNNNDAADVRASVGISLGKLAGNPLAGVTDTQKTALLEQLHALQSDETVLLRRYAPLALALTGDESTIPWVVAALQDEDLDVFHSAAEALGQYGQAAVPHLLAILASGADDAQCVAAWKLGELGNDDALEPLVVGVEAGLTHPPTITPNLTALCVWALGEIGTRTPTVLAVLHRAEHSTTLEISQRAKWALKKIARNWN